MNVSAIQRVTCRFAGHVQGVGFRYTTLNIALEYDVQGFVRNLPDGRVELVMEGSSHDLDAMLDEVKQRLEDFISDVQITYGSATGEFRRFSIQH